MKIGFVIGTLNYSGAEKIARHLIDALYKQYHYEVGIILIPGEDKPYSEFDYAKQFLIKNKGNRFTSVFNRQKRIRQIAEKENYNVVVSFGVKFNLDVMEALKHTKTKVILCERNDPISDPHRKILRIRRYLCYPYATGYVFQTDQIADFFGEKIKNKSTIIPNFIEKEQKNLYKSNVGNNILVTARLDDIQKNISMLLQAFAEFSTDYDYRLYIVGKGPDEQKFKQLANDLRISDKVVFTGQQSVYDYLKTAQIYVLPSNYEGMPNSLIEAMASGIPCIATDCSGGGAAYLINDHLNGTLIPIDGKDELVVALKELADNPELRLKYSYEAHKINNRLRFGRIIEKWIEYIEQVGNR